jgi:hypothetical protein
MISHFFIDRPIFAAVLSIVITIMGTAALTSLPIAQYPDISPPTVIVTASYPGANAQTVLDTVAAPIEQQVSGVENMLYMSSQCANDGSYTLLVTFKLGMDANMAQVLVQNRVSLGLPNVPDLVQREGVAVKKISPSIMMIINMFSEKDPQLWEKINLNSPMEKEINMLCSEDKAVTSGQLFCEIPSVGNINIKFNINNNEVIHEGAEETYDRVVTNNKITYSLQTDNAMVRFDIDLNTKIIEARIIDGNKILDMKKGTCN